MTSKTAVILGATGLVGSHCVDELLSCGRYGRVLAVGRRPLDHSDPRLESVVGDLGDLESLLAGIAADDAFCCLGTTIRKAGSQEAFARVDRGMPVDAARVLQGGGLKQFLVVSAMGADPHSKIFYNRVKGLMEQDLAALGLPSVAVFRPSLLAGDRAESRPAERIGICAARALRFAFVGPLRDYALIEGATVARAMVRVAQDPEPDMRVILSGEIEDIGS